MTKRLVKFKAILKTKNTDAILISSIPNITYLTGFSSFSKDEREAFLLVVAQPQGLTHKTPGVLGYILTDGRYSEAVKNNVKDFELIEISSKHSFEKALKDLAKKHSPRGETRKIKKLGFEGNNITFLEHKALKKYFNNIYHLRISDLRNIKTSQEISTIEDACRLGDKAFKYILGKIKSGVTEKELAFEIEFFIKKNGADISFPPIVAFGKHSSVPHHVPTHSSLLPTHNSIVLLDFGVKLNNYCSDMTRTVLFGSANAELKRMYQTVLEAQQESIDCLNRRHSERSEESHEILRLKAQDDIRARDVDKIARDYIISKGYPTIPHSLGHGIGLEVHEAPKLSPKSKDVLKPGMVFTIEPGIYLPNFGGVRIEDVVSLERSGPRLLTKSPKEIIEL